MSKGDEKAGERRAALLGAFASTWPDADERGERILDLYTALFVAGKWRTGADLLRAVGMPESRIWALVEAVAEENAGEAFAVIYEPEGMGDESRDG